VKASDSSPMRGSHAKRARRSEHLDPGERDVKPAKRKGRSPFDDVLGAMTAPPAPSPSPLQKTASPPRAERKRSESRESAPLRPAISPALAPPPAPCAPEISAPAPVHVPRAALDDASFLVSIRPGSATIRVQPAPDAAAVTLRIGVQQGVTTIRAEGAGSVQLLAGRQHELEAALSRHGLRLGSLELPPPAPAKKPEPAARRRDRPFHLKA